MLNPAVTKIFHNGFVKVLNGQFDIWFEIAELICREIKTLKSKVFIYHFRGYKVYLYLMNISFFDGHTCCSFHYHPPQSGPRTRFWSLTYTVYIYRSSYKKTIVSSEKCNTFSSRLVRFLRGVGTASTLRDTCHERDSEGECWLRS